MPFTGSHPAAVLPLLGIGLPPSALVIGSMVPDLPYFVPLPVGSGFTHTLVGAVTVDVVLALAVYAVWHALLVPPLLAWSPQSLRGRLPRRPAVGSVVGFPVDPRAGVPGWLGGSRRLALVAAGCAVGAFTHVAWDAFTHDGRWGTQRVAWLTAQHGLLPGYRWAQYASGVVGLVLLATWLRGWWRRTQPRAEASGVVAVGPRAAWSGGPGGPTQLQALLAVVAGVLVGAALRPLPALLDGDLGLRRAVFLLVTGAGSGALVALAVLTCWWHVTAGRRRERFAAP